MTVLFIFCLSIIVIAFAPTKRGHRPIVLVSGPARPTTEHANSAPFRDTEQCTILAKLSDKLKKSKDRNRAAREIKEIREVKRKLDRLDKINLESYMKFNIDNDLNTGEED